MWRLLLNCCVVSSITCLASQAGLEVGTPKNTSCAAEGSIPARSAHSMLQSGAKRLKPQLSADPSDGCWVSSITKRVGKYSFENSWNIRDLESGATICSGDEYHKKYTSGADVDTACCLVKGVRYVLTCQDKTGDGWNGGYLEINAVRFCADSFGRYSETTFTGEPVPCSGWVTTVKKKTSKFTLEDSWSITDSTGSMACSGDGYLRLQVNTVSCCLPAGWYTLSCRNSWSWGWNGGYLEIDNTRYCEDFTAGAEKRQAIFVGPPTPAPTPLPAPLPCSVSSIAKRVGKYSFENSWKISELDSGATICSGDEYHKKYTSGADVDTACCLVKGVRYVLTCQDKMGDGWNGGYLEINAVRFCADSFGRYAETTFTGEPVPCSGWVTSVKKKTTQFTLEDSWSITDSTGSMACSGHGYLRMQVFSVSCCLPAGWYTLSCRNSWSWGWNGGYLEIDNTRYCEDFTAGAEKTERIHVGPPALPAPLPTTEGALSMSDLGN